MRLFSGAALAEALRLHRSGFLDLLAHRGAGGAVAGGGQFLEGHRRHLDVQVDAVQQRAADLAHVVFDLHRRALARVLRRRPGSRTGRGSSTRPGRSGPGRSSSHEDARDGDLALFQRLAQHFQAAAVELGQFVEEQNAVVGQARFRRAAGVLPPPTMPASLMVWCGARKGRTVSSGSPGGSRPMAV